LAGYLGNDLFANIYRLSRNELGIESARALGQALANNQTLCELFIESISCGPEGILAVAESLLVNSTLTKLYLFGNNINNECASVLARALQGPETSLSVLDLQVNDIGNEGILAIAIALRTNSTLTDLNLRKNQFGDEGARALGQALEKNNTLEALSFSENNTANKGACAFAKALRTNTRLKSLV